MFSLKGYFDEHWSSQQTKWRHVQSDRNIAISGRQQVEEERLMKPFQEVV